MRTYSRLQERDGFIAVGLDAWMSVQRAAEYSPYFSYLRRCLSRNTRSFHADFLRRRIPPPKSSACVSSQPVRLLRNRVAGTSFGTSHLSIPSFPPLNRADCSHSQLDKVKKAKGDILAVNVVSTDRYSHSPKRRAYWS